MTPIFFMVDVKYGVLYYIRKKRCLILFIIREWYHVIFKVYYSKVYIITPLPLR